MLDATGIVTATVIDITLELQHERPVRGQSNFILTGFDHGHDLVSEYRSLQVNIEYDWKLNFLGAYKYTALRIN